MDPRDLVVLSRPLHWVKNVFVLMPLPFALAAGARIDPLAFLLGLLGFCLANSAVYAFNDAQDVADKFKVNVPVILNLQGVDRDLSRRIIDFASGLCYGLGGQMERVANQVYLLTPNDVEVSPEERRRLSERGYEA